MNEIHQASETRLSQGKRSLSQAMKTQIERLIGEIAHPEDLQIRVTSTETGVAIHFMGRGAGRGPSTKWSLFAIISGALGIVAICRTLKLHHGNDLVVAAISLSVSILLFLVAHYRGRIATILVMERDGIGVSFRPCFPFFCRQHAIEWKHLRGIDCIVDKTANKYYSGTSMLVISSDGGEHIRVLYHYPFHGLKWAVTFIRSIQTLLRS